MHYYNYARPAGASLTTRLAPCFQVSTPVSPARAKTSNRWTTTISALLLRFQVSPRQTWT